MGGWSLSHVYLEIGLCQATRITLRCITDGLHAKTANTTVRRYAQRQRGHPPQWFSDSEALIEKIRVIRGWFARGGTRTNNLSPSRECALRRGDGAAVCGPFVGRSPLRGQAVCFDRARGNPQGAGCFCALAAAF